jgi:hypothetical protein
MFATKIKGQVTTDRQLVVEIPPEVNPGEVEVIILHETPTKTSKKRARRKASHPAFGLWAKRDIESSQKLAVELRQKLESRSDGQ